MLYNLPPLNGLRAFEAAARNLSFKKAGKELGVTPGAVSLRIKDLEQSLGKPLFRRMTRSISLTDTGKELAPAVQEAFRLLSHAMMRLDNRDRAGPLIVSVLPSFAAKWLVPRLGRFHERHPEIEVWVWATPLLVDFARENLNVAIRHGLGSYPGLHSERLFTEALFPVCSPKLLDGQRPLREPADLAHHTLLHDQLRQDWRMWCQALGFTGIDTLRGPGFSDDGLVLQAAIEGQGVALGRMALVEGDLREGRLVSPFEVNLPSAFAYYLVYPEAVAEQPKVAAFREWLLEEAEQGLDK